MIAVDTNILIHAHRADAPHHKACLTSLKRLAEGAKPWAIPVFCIGEFLRVTTHPRVFNPPSSIKQATQWLKELLLSPSHCLLLPGDDYPVLLMEQMARADAKGNLVFDAQIAALCVEHGVDALMTRDRDFARFDCLRILDPVRCD